MCGIAGIISPSSLDIPEFELVNRMREALFHRGPDSEGSYLSPHAAFSVRRLAIIDLEKGAQPLKNEDNSIILVANGEIYNHQELRRELQGRGHQFLSGSDCETIVHLYEEEGPSCIHRLRGMFAFALLDIRQGKVMLARDRMGEKPLYLHKDGDRLFFASELKALLRSGVVPHQLHPDAVHRFFLYSYVPEPLTILQEVRKLPPAHYLLIDLHTGRTEETCYWRLEEASPLEGDPVEHLRNELEKVAELIIRADVPVGIALSGGLDSSAIAALIAAQKPGLLQAFCIGYDDRPPCDERQDAKQTAGLLGLPFHEAELSTRGMTAFFPELVALQDDPIADLAGFGYHLVMRLAKEKGVPVMLSGIGGDELFWGYPWVREAIQLALWQKNRTRGTAPGPPHAGTTRSPFYELTPDFRSADRESRYLYTSDFQGLLGDSDPYGSFSLEESLPPDIRIIRLICDTYLLENGIVQNDRLSMASSVELRLPFVDYRLLETVIGLRKVQFDAFLPPKSWLKESVSHLLPNTVLNRPKRGFTPPVRDWYHALMRTHGGVLHHGYLTQNHIFRPQMARDLALRPFPPSAIMPLAYKALVLETWCRKILCGTSWAQGIRSAIHVTDTPVSHIATELYVREESIQRPYLSIVFATKDRLQYIKTTMSSITQELEGEFDYEVVIVDGQSSDGTIEYLKTQNHVRLLVEDKPRGCCYAYDMAFRAARGEWVCWLNDDVKIVPGSFTKMMQFMTAPNNNRVGLGAFTSSRSSRELHRFILNTCTKFPIPYANFGILRRELLEKLGFLDLTYQKYAWDPDLALKIWDAGYTVEPCPGAHIIHYFAEDEIRHQDEPHRVPDCNYMAEKWKNKAKSIARNIELRNSYKSVWKELEPRLQIWLLAHKGWWDEAEEMAFATLLQEPQALTQFYLLGIELEKNGGTEQAASIYKRVMQHADKDTNLAAWAHFKFGEYLNKQGKVVQGKQHWRKALALNPDHAKAQILLLPAEDPLNVLCSPQKCSKPRHIWVAFDPTDPTLWEYYFSTRKISNLEVYSSLPFPDSSVFSSCLRRHLKPGGTFRLLLPESTGGEDTTIRPLTNSINKEGLVVKESRPGMLTGTLPKSTEELNTAVA